MKLSRKEREVRAPAHSAFLGAWRDVRKVEPRADGGEISRATSVEIDPKHRQLTALAVVSVAIALLMPGIAARQQPAPSGWELIVLGIAQDQLRRDQV